MLNEELKVIAGQALIGRAKDICVPLPLSKDQADQLLLWMLSNAQQMNGFACDHVSPLMSRRPWPFPTPGAQHQELLITSPMPPAPGTM